MENNNKKRGPGRPKKIKNENPEKLENPEKIIVPYSFKPEEQQEHQEHQEQQEQQEHQKHQEHQEHQEKGIRLPDESKKEMLVPSNSNYFESEFDNDDDFHKALIESRKQQNNLEQDFLKDSEEEYIFQQLIQQINIEEIEKRSISLPQFTKRLERLSFSESDRAIRDIITPIIIEYKLNKCNNVVLEQCIYDNIYENFIDTLYKKPINLGKTTTAITKDEDELIRKIFLKKE
jgi:hypothetical protein